MLPSAPTHPQPSTLTQRTPFLELPVGRYFLLIGDTRQAHSTTQATSDTRCHRLRTLSAGLMGLCVAHARQVFYYPESQQWGVWFAEDRPTQLQPKPAPPSEPAPKINWRSALNPARTYRPAPAPQPESSQRTQPNPPQPEPAQQLETAQQAEPAQRVEPDTRPANRRGRPPGSKNKPKDTTESAPISVLQPSKQSGRPPSSTNKNKAGTELLVEPVAQSSKRKGPPLGTKSTTKPDFNSDTRPAITKLIDVPLAFRMVFPGSGSTPAGTRQIAKDELPGRRQDLHDTTWPYRYPALVKADVPHLGVRVGDKVVIRSKRATDDPKSVRYPSTIGADGKSVRGRDVLVPNAALTIGVHAALEDRWLYVAGYGDPSESGLSQQEITSPLATALTLSYTAWRQTEFPSKALQWLQVATDDRSKMDRLVQGSLVAIKSAGLFEVFSRPDFSLDEIFAAGTSVHPTTSGGVGANIDRGVYGLRYSDFPRSSPLYGTTAFKVGKTNMATAEESSRSGGFSGRFYGHEMFHLRAKAGDRHAAISGEAGKSEMVVLACTDDPVQQTLLEQFFTSALDTYHPELSRPELSGTEGAIFASHYDWVQCFNNIMPAVFQAAKWPGGIQRGSFSPFQRCIGMNVMSPLSEGGFAKKSWLSQTIDGVVTVLSRPTGEVHAKGHLVHYWPKPIAGDLNLAASIINTEEVRILPKESDFSPEEFALLPEVGQQLEIAIELTEDGRPHTFSHCLYPRLGRRSDHGEGLQWALRFQWPGPNGQLCWMYVQRSSSPDLNTSPPPGVQAWATAVKRYAKNETRNSSDEQSFDFNHAIIWKANFRYLEQCWHVTEARKQLPQPVVYRKTDSEMEDALTAMGAVLVPRGQRADREEGCDGSYLSGAEYIQEDDYCVLCNRYERPCTSTAEVDSDAALKARLEAALCPPLPAAPRVYTGPSAAVPFTPPF
ncbi:unnamed protein product [Zymoseptoria tritici ST99CH_3D1]|nr:unnamed protein product [Zymoseptoria tritici ST99CH_3D1]